jgi:ABC-2 type transport system permease protein
MRKLWLIAKEEYLRRVKQKSFLVTVLGFPALMIVIGGISVLVALGGRDARPLGYVDLSGVLDERVVPALRAESGRFTEMRVYDDEDAASAALRADEIQAYYVVPEDYLSAKEARLVYMESEPSQRTRQDFQEFVRASLVRQQPAEVRPLLSEGFNVAVRSADGRRELSARGIVGFILPFVMIFLLFFAISTAGGYLLQAVTEEKENRTMEVIVTSVSPEQLIAGKSLGLIGVSLTQILTWVSVIVVGVIVLLYANEGLDAVSLPWDVLGLAIAFFVPTFGLIAGIMITIGGIVTEAQQGQQISGLINMLFILPIFFMVLVLSRPDSPFMVGLTLFPTTAFLTILLRWSVSTVPLWQLAVSWGLLVISAAASIWLGARVFRLGMLRYGQRLRIGAVVEGLRTGRTPQLRVDAADKEVV